MVPPQERGSVMTSVFLSLLLASCVGTLVWIAQNVVRPVTRNLFSQTWHYYAGLIPAFFFLGGAEIVSRLIAFARSRWPAPSPSAASVAERTAAAVPLEGVAANRPSVLQPLLDAWMRFEHMQEAATIGLTIWSLGAAAFLFVCIEQYRRFRRSILRDSRVCALTKDHIQVFISPHATTPMAMDLWKPAIVLPDIDWDEKELSMILSHELTHVQRHDLVVKSLVLFANAMHWFNPAAYAWSRQIYIYSELSCDEKVVQSMDMKDRALYGETLLSMLEYGVMQRSAIGASRLYHPKEDMRRRLGNLMRVRKAKASIVVMSFVAGMTFLVGGSVVSYAAASGLAFGKPAEGRNIYVQSPDGTVVHYDRDGRAAPAKPRIRPTYDEAAQRKIDGLAETIQSYIDRGLSVPREIVEAYTTEELMAALRDVRSYVYEGNEIRPFGQ